LKLSKKGIADRSPQQVRASSTPTSGRSFSSDAIARDAGHPLTSTEGVVALFAYACDTLSRVKASSTMRSTIAGTESGTASWANFATPAS
jgi:hypothetical protein